MEIIRRLGIEKGTFVEIGVGNGLENNTLVLLAKGWNGVWVGGQSLAFQIPEDCSFFNFQQKWIDRENIQSVVMAGLKSIHHDSEIDLLSIDIDSNDLYIAKSLLEGGLAPKAIIVEYNSKFPPTVEWSVVYDKDHRWFDTDYMGASLGAFVALFQRFGYQLICCNITGSNAFFVKKAFMSYFPEVPPRIEDIFCHPVYHLFMTYGHQTSPKTVETILLQRGALKL